MPLFPLAAPIPADELDNEIATNRMHLIAVEAQALTLDARLTAAEAKLASSPPPVNPVVIIDIPASLEAKLAAVAVGSPVILRAPNTDFTLVRQ